MSVPKGRPKTGGRQKGTLNKVTADIKVIAQQYTERAMEELARVAFNSESDAARVAAIKEIFDRGHGKATQALHHSGPNGTALAPPIFNVNFGKPDGGTES